MRKVDTVALETLILEKVRIKSQKIIPRHVIENVVVRRGPEFLCDELSEHVSDDLIADLTAYVTANKESNTTYEDEQVTTENVVEYPATLWDHFKQRFPRLTFLCSPPRTIIQPVTQMVHKDITVNNYKVCPHLTLPTSRESEEPHYSHLRMPYAS